MGSDDEDDVVIPLNATLVTRTLHQQCESVPGWLDDPVYLDPAATLYMALFSVLAYTMYHRLSGLTVKTAVAAFRSWFAR